LIAARLPCRWGRVVHEIEKRSGRRTGLTYLRGRTARCRSIDPRQDHGERQIGRHACVIEGHEVRDVDGSADGIRRIHQIGDVGCVDA